MILLAGFAFLAGVVTILSPCILPLLPIILSSSVTGSKKRPVGVVLGFVLSFTFFTLFLSAIVRATNLSADALRTLSVVILIAFGASLLFPRFQQWMEKLFTKLSSVAPQRQGSGLSGGILVGVSLGLIWTPCVGPILASVISLALTGSVSGAAVIITLAYALGTGLPMLAIMFGGRALLQKAPWLMRNTGKIQKAFGILMIITAIGIFYNVDRTFQSYILDKFPNYGVGLTSFEDNEVVQKNLQGLDGEVNEDDIGKPMDELMGDKFMEAPELIPGGEWFNSEPLTISGLEGKVVLVDFWTYSCINCIRTLPYLREWHETYSDDGLVIIGVHTPEFEFEKNPDNLAKAISDFELKYPIVQDNDYKTWRAYSNRYWPAKYLIDKDGRIRYTHFGEGKYDETEEMIQNLLKETGASVSKSDIDNPDYDNQSRTPELYLGYQRIRNLVSPEAIAPDEAQTYTRPTSIPLHGFAFAGEWTMGAEYALPGAGSFLELEYESANVFLVMRPVNGPAQVTANLDGQKISGENAGQDVEDGIITVDSDRLYSLLELTDGGRHTLTLDFPDGGVELFAFTFG